MMTAGKSVQGPIPQPRHQTDKRKQKIINGLMLMTYTLTHILLKVSLSCTLLKTMKLSSKMTLNGRSPTMRHVSRTQSCAWLGVRQDQFRTQDPDQICWHQKPTRRHANQRKVCAVTNEIVFFVCSASWVSRFSLAVISVIFFLIRSESRASCQKDV